ncbi:glutathione S-transferase family protein [Acinetobacter stercoris]|uniref:glutathione transferase n=1 Tax=Acinetobacter stercoris TaxID=2126983 RepID=A0A2U3MVJ3_9GAMM|nr:MULTISPECIES: glutathione S-transferase [Acinetobacter]SPL69451.1 Dichloromethane dehalogenase [Acinetobacter stercoris]
MITLHHLEHSRSFRILWALEELGLDYQIKYYKRTSSYEAPAELKKIHPLGKAPILTDGDLTITESAVILDYLQEKYDVNKKFKPEQPEHLMQYNYWMHYAEGSLMPLLVMNLVLSQVSAKVPFLIQPVANKIVKGVKAGYITPRVCDHIEFLESHLSGREYFAGDFSFADIQMSFPIIALQERVQGQYLKIKDYSDKIQQRPAFIQAKIKSADL